MEQIDSANPPQVATIEPYNLMTNEPPSETEYITVPDEVFIFLFRFWIKDLKKINFLFQVNK